MTTNTELNNKYKEFIEIINKNIDEEITIDESTICNKIERYYQCIHENKKFKKYLLDRRDKLFYANNIKLFDNINIRKILEKVDEKQTNELWNYLQLFYILNNTDNDNYTLKLIENIESKLKSKTTPETTETTKTTETTETNPLIDDLLNSIQELLKEIDINDNPLQKIINISQILADKYRDDIQAGNISLDDIIKYINKFMNNNELGENIFDSLDLSEKNINKVFSNILNNEQLKSLINLDNIGGDNLNNNLISNLFENLLENNIKNEKIDENKLKKMEEYFNNVSTDNCDNLLELDDDEDSDDNKSLNNLSEMLFSQINNIKNNIDSKLNENQTESEPINMEELDKLKNKLMSELTDEQQTEIKNLTENLLSGFGLK